MIIFEHTFPLGFIALLLCIALLAGSLSAWKFLPRRSLMGFLFGLYVMIVLGLTWCILLPGSKNEVTQLKKPRFIIVLDQTKSMALSPSKDAHNRWDTALEALQQPWMKTIANQCDIEIHPFAAELGEAIPLDKAITLKPDGNSTHLREALKKITERSAGLNVAGLLLLSDGADTSESSEDWTNAERPFPVYTLRMEPAGIWQKEPDLRIDAVTTARRVSVGWKTEFKVKVSGQGTRGAPSIVQVFENGKLRIEKPTQIPDEGGEREVVFQLEHPKIGVFNYRVAVSPLPGEKNLADNESQLNVEVVDVHNQLLYVEGIPRWEYKFLRRTLLSETEISPVIFFTGANGAPQEGTSVGNLTADMSPEQLAFFKIVMLGNLDAKELGNQRAKNLVKFVEDGGSLILLGGAKAWADDGLGQTDLGKILPVRGSNMKVQEGDKPFPVRLSELAAGHPAFAGDAALWKNIPPILSLFTGFKLSLGAETLVSADTPQGSQPVVVTQHFGQGKITAILTDSLWRWQLGPEAGKEKPYERFWKQLISWLLPHEETHKQTGIEVFADRDRIYLGEKVGLNARMNGTTIPTVDAMEARITLPDEREIPYRMAPQQVTFQSGKTFPGYAFAFTPEKPGLYRMVAAAKVNGKPITSEPFSFYVAPYSPETVPQPARTDVLQTLSKSSGGEFYQNVTQLNSGLTDLKFIPDEEKSSSYQTLWQKWPMLVGLMLLFLASWIIRKLKNMP